MYRNVYWHHAVRSATAMYKRLVDGALRAGSLSAETLAAFTDEGLLHELATARAVAAARRAARAPALQARLRVPRRRARRRTSANGSPTTARSSSPSRTSSRASSDSQPGELLLDYPVKTQMLGLDIPVLRRNGSVRRLTAEGWEGAINLPDALRGAVSQRALAARLRLPPVAIDRARHRHRAAGDEVARRSTRLLLR